MKTRRVLVLMMVLFTAVFSAKAQNNISVASFQILPFDLTANTKPNIRIDQNGHTCALIKVVTTQTGFSFDVGIMGVTDTQQEPGEIWVWVPFGVKHITIRHPQLGVLRDYYFPNAIEEARTYEMVLISGKVTNIIEEDIGGSYLVITVEPKSAQIYIDDKPKSVENGEVMSLLPYGKHTYRVEAPGYKTEAGIIEIGKERKELKISLASTKATLTVNCADAKADIYINGEKKGRGSWTGQLDEGMYAIEASKPSHRTVKQSLTLAEQEQKVITLNAPQPMYGQLDLQSTPANCDVFIDGEKIGKSPDFFREVFVGSHRIELQRDGYHTVSKQIEIKEGQITKVNLYLEANEIAKTEPAKPKQDPSNEDKPISFNSPTGIQDTRDPITFSISNVCFQMIPVKGAVATNSEGNSTTINDYYIGKTEVTQSLWQAVMKNNPSNFVGDDLPVEEVSYEECIEFINKLNRLLATQLGGKRFDLPTENEWLFAAQGGQKNKGYKFSGSDNLNDVAWHSGNSNSQTHPVGKKQANELGLFDMSGNVWEWCSGNSNGQKCIGFGGSWDNSASMCTSCSQAQGNPKLHSGYLGLRLVLR